MKIDDLEGRRALITGASTGIGAAVARAFADQGIIVALHYNSNRDAAHSLAADIAKAGGKAHLVSGDLARPGEGRRVVEAAAATLDGLDILVNNAGSLVRRTPFADLSDDLITEIVDLNGRAVVTACQAAIPIFEGRGGGTIINVGSIAGVVGGGSGASIYGAAKGFVHNLTRHLATELAGKNIRVNAVAPGVIDTPFHAATPPERKEAMRRTIPMGRLGTAADCVGAFLFLASPGLSGFVTGQIVHVNGGQYMA